MGITIEKASNADVTFIAESILISSRAKKSVGVFDLLFDSNDDKTIIKSLEKLLVTETKSYVHVSNFLLAYEDKKVAGCLCGYESRIVSDEILEKALAEIGCDGSYKKRIEAYTTCAPDLGRRSWVINFIHVQKGFTALSIIKEMVQKSLLNARLKGYRKATALIEIGSAEVELIYKKLGFRFESEQRSDIYLEVFSRLGIMRYSVEL